MPNRHRIRLSGPWVFAKDHRILEKNEASKYQTTKPPINWQLLLGQGFTGQVLFQRSFNQPTGLADRQSVYLTIKNEGFSAEISLNDHHLGSMHFTDPKFECDIRNRLAHHNRLNIVVPFGEVKTGKPNPDGSTTAGPYDTAPLILGDVQLEICQMEP